MKLHFSNTGNINTCFIVGLGQIGMGYDYKLDPKNFILSHARSFSLNPDFELIGGCDNDPNLRMKFEEEYKKPAFMCLEKALQSLKPTVVVIATPTSMHASTLDKILKYSTPKAIVCEKPLDVNLHMAHEMVKKCDINGIKLFVNYMRRSEKSVLRIKKMIEDEEIRSPIKAIVWYSKGLFNNGSHVLNLLEYWLGTVQSHSIIDFKSSIKTDDPEPDFKVIFEKGSAHFYSGWAEYFPHLSVELMCPSGRLYYSNGGYSVEWQPSDASFEKPKAGYLDKRIIIDSNFEKYQYNFTINLALALKGEKHELSTGKDALETLKNIYSILGKV